jgi:hypothetical protein
MNRNNTQGFLSPEVFHVLIISGLSTDGMKACPDKPQGLFSDAELSAACRFTVFWII